MTPLLKIDLHVHTCYSYDGLTTLKEVISYSKKRALSGVAITDHDTLAGALQLIRSSQLLVIPGVEVSTQQGHILALNVTTPIPPKMRPSETIQRIHEAGGIAVAAHPGVVYKARWRLKTASALKFDAVEVVNSASFPFSLSTYLSRQLAARLSLPQTAGSDSHIPDTIGSAYTVVDSDPGVNEVIRAIQRGKTIPCGGPIPWTARLKKILRRKKKKGDVKVLGSKELPELSTQSSRADRGLGQS